MDVLKINDDDDMMMTLIFYIWQLLFRPLHIAARNGLVSIVQLLISKGANIFAVDSNGKQCFVYDQLKIE